MSPKTNLDVAIFIDIESRDGGICRCIGDQLNKRNLSVKCFSLKEEAKVYKKTNVKLAIINKPHLFLFHRILQKLKGTKFIVLDTEGILPGQNRQHVLFEPEGYIHWFKHQADRYKFKYTKTVVVGYPRQPFLIKTNKPKKNLNLVTVATNFSILGYELSEVLKRQNDRKLKLVNDWSLLDYRKFQEHSLDLMHEVFLKNPDKQFIVKPHPNDPQDLWDEIELPKNVELFVEPVPVNNLFMKNPTAHLCLDGCTTVLDAYILGIPVFTIGKFVPLENSLLRSLVFKENNKEAKLEFSGLNSHSGAIITPSYPHKQVKYFKNELQIFNMEAILNLVEQVISDQPRSVFYDYPKKQHFIYWLKNMLKTFILYKAHKTNRKKFTNI